MRPHQAQPGKFLISGLYFIYKHILVTIDSNNLIFLLDILEYLYFTRICWFLISFSEHRQLSAFSGFENYLLTFDAVHAEFSCLATEQEAWVVGDLDIFHLEDFFEGKGAETADLDGGGELPVVVDVPKVYAAVSARCYQCLLVLGEYHRCCPMRHVVIFSLRFENCDLSLENKIPHFDDEVLSRRQQFQRILIWIEL